MECTAILGLGLMGGSLALALRRRDPGGELRLYARRAETRAAALARGLADTVEDQPVRAVRDATRVVVCVPVEQIPGLVRSCLPGLAPGAVVTDVGSTKAWIQAETGRVLAGSVACFVGSHPIAGSERQGLEAARADLYEGAVTVVTGGEGDPRAAGRVEQLWRSVGSDVIRMNAEEHDRVLARTSHLPHLAAAMLAAVAGRDPQAERWRTFCGSGFRDSTRIAEGGPELWIEIVRTNREAIAGELDALARSVETLSGAIRSGADDTVLSLLEEGRCARRRMLGGETGLDSSDQGEANDG